VLVPVFAYLEFRGALDVALSSISGEQALIEERSSRDVVFFSPESTSQ
jgi:hypothetical protein